MTEDMLNHVNGETTGRKTWPPKPDTSRQVEVPVADDIVPRLRLQMLAKDWVEQLVDDRTPIRDVRALAKSIAGIIEAHNEKYTK